MQGGVVMKITAKAKCQVYKAFLVDKCSGMFDLEEQKTSSVQFDVELPDYDEDWKVGVIVGPSGSGKTTVAKEAYGDKVYQTGAWPTDKAVIDGFDQRDVKVITEMLTTIGFSSPPAWVKPYQVLSNGEKFRCDLAKALLAEQDVCVFDEFTSVVDRTVAKIGSAALRKTINKGRVKSKFVAVTCHYDIIDWLEPDWVLDMASGQLARGCLYRRPAIELSIYKTHSRLWKLFARHHYLNTADVRGRNYVALLDDKIPVAFVSVLPNMGKRNHWRLSRTVVMPDYQGIGIGSKVAEAVAQMFTDQGNKVTAVTTHPAMIAHRTKSKAWRTTNVKKHGTKPAGIALKEGYVGGRAARARVSFAYVPRERRSG